MDFSHININQICSVRGYCVSFNKNYEYWKHKPKKGFFSKEIQEGFYETYYDDSYSFRSAEQIERSGDKFCEGEKVFNKAYLIVTMSNKDEHKKIFDSNIEMFEFICNSPLARLNWLDTTKTLTQREVLLEKHQGYSDEFRIILKRSIQNSEFA